MPRRRVFRHVTVQHYCTECGARCMPSSKFEAETQSPMAGVKRPTIMLRSYNASHKNEKYAWCFSCGGFRPQRRLLEDEILELYLSRKGVGYRNKGQLATFLIAAGRRRA